MWIKLLSAENMGTLLKPQFVKGKWNKPVIQGR
jgi:phosphopantetheinyl transferase